MSLLFSILIVVALAFGADVSTIDRLVFGVDEGFRGHLLAVPPPFSLSPPSRNDWSLGTSTSVLEEALLLLNSTTHLDAWHLRINRYTHHLLKSNNPTRQLHFLHVPSTNASAIPLLLLHGWPGGFFEFLDVIPLLLPKFHIVILSLPGFGLSTYVKMNSDETALERIARELQHLMDTLHYSSYVVQGGDWGSMLGVTLCNANRASCRGVHVNFSPWGAPFSRGLRGLLSVAKAYLFPSWSFPDNREREVAQRNLFPLSNIWHRTAYMHLQATRPQTLALTLSSSPVALCVWLLEKYHEWDGGLPLEKQVDAVLWYWFTNRGASVQIYNDVMSVDNFAAFMQFCSKTRFDAPIGYSSFREFGSTPLKWFKYAHSNVVYYNQR
jgi:pimeloyl-ACP methyl ester carboxylesterase